MQDFVLMICKTSSLFYARLRLDEIQDFVPFYARLRLDEIQDFVLMRYRTSSWWYTTLCVDDMQSLLGIDEGVLTDGLVYALNTDRAHIKLRRKEHTSINSAGIVYHHGEAVYIITVKPCISSIPKGLYIINTKCCISSIPNGIAYYCLTNLPFSYIIKE